MLPDAAVWGKPDLGERDPRDFRSAGRCPAGLELRGSRRTL